MVVFGQYLGEHIHNGEHEKRADGRGHAQNCLVFVEWGHIAAEFREFAGFYNVILSYFAVSWDMVGSIQDKNITLGGLIKKAQASPMAQGAASTAEDRLADLVSLSDEAKSKLTRSRKVSGYLQMFGTFLKLLNAPAAHAAVPGYDLDGTGKKTSFQKDV